jgi:hypothetical protein
MSRRTILVLLTWLVLLAVEDAVADDDVLNIVQQCEFKNPGNDQQSTLSITLIDKDGNERKNVYTRLWKNYHGKDDVADKMVLYTEFPPDAKGTGFMRWGYIAGSGKTADQWLYLPHLRKVRRVSVRDPGDSFLGSDLTYGDIEDRSIDADSYRLLDSDEKNGIEVFEVEITPKESDSLYSKKISWYAKKGNWDDCIRFKTDYYDRHGNILKKQGLKWQKIKDAWVWENVVVENVQTQHRSVFSVSNVKINIGLEDGEFTERAIKRGRY